VAVFGYRYFREGPLSIGLLGSLLLATVFCLLVAFYAVGLFSSHS